MLAFDYIKSELNNFIIKFPKTRIRYENDTNSKTHSIEVIPNEIFHLNKDYITWEDNFFDAFINEFPDQNICFISDDAIVGLDKIDFEVFGREYNSLNSIIPTSNLINSAISNIKINSKNNTNNSKDNIYIVPNIRVDLKTNLFQPNTKVVENILNQFNYPLAA